jgi:ferritin-like protein
MAGASTTLHESPEQLRPLTVDIHRAIVSLQEELEAVDWYRQRADAAGDEELRQVLLHNMEEEMEHASMLLEWIRRHEPLLDEKLRTYLFTAAPLLAVEQQEEKGAEPARALPPLTVGAMKGV